jgi:hypothetical protein
MANTVAPNECFKFKHFVVEQKTDCSYGDPHLMFELRSETENGKMEMSTSQIVEFVNQLISLYAEFNPCNMDDIVFTFSRELEERTYNGPTYLIATKIGEKTKIRLLEFKNGHKGEGHILYQKFEIDLEDDVYLFAAFVLKIINYSRDSKIGLTFDL